MREIKFRAWDKKRKIWTNFQIYILDNSIRYMDKNLGTWHSDKNNERFILMQYTGLKDKNGIEIYEGDIVHWTDNGIKSDGTLEDKVEVYWNDEYMKWCCVGINWRDKSIIEELYDYSDVETIEVIGNIYENPELLEQDQPTIDVNGHGE